MFFCLFSMLVMYSKVVIETNGKGRKGTGREEIGGEGKDWTIY